MAFIMQMNLECYYIANVKPHITMPPMIVYDKIYNG